MNGLGGLLEAGVLTNIVCLFRVYSKCISAARDFGNSRSGGAHFDYIRSLKFCVCKKFFLRNGFNLKVWNFFIKIFNFNLFFVWHNFQQLKCRDKGNCRLDKNYRRYCKLCRMQKCILIGMKKVLY